MSFFVSDLTEGLLKHNIQIVSQGAYEAAVRGQLY